MTCPVPACKYEFCRICGGSRFQAEAHGNHYHLAQCKYFCAKGEEDGDDKYRPVYTEGMYDVRKGKKKAGDTWCLECKEGGKLCTPPGDQPMPTSEPTREIGGECVCVWGGGGGGG